MRELTGEREALPVGLLDSELLCDLVRGALPIHEGHDGVPGAPSDVVCVRCRADKALTALVSRLHASPDAEAMQARLKAHAERAAQQFGWRWEDAEAFAWAICEDFEV